MFSKAWYLIFFGSPVFLCYSTDVAVCGVGALAREILFGSNTIGCFGHPSIQILYSQEQR